jgi:hypothetical protein
MVISVNQLESYQAYDWSPYLNPLDHPIELNEEIEE